MTRMWFVACLAVSACATSTAQGPKDGTAAGAGSASESEDVICHEEAPTGSSITHEVCRPRERTEQDRDAAQRNMRTQRPTPPPPQGGR